MPLVNQTGISSRVMQAVTLEDTRSNRSQVPTRTEMTSELTAALGRVSPQLSLNIEALIDEVVRKKVLEHLPKTPALWEAYVRNSENGKIHRTAVGPDSLLPNQAWCTVCGWYFGRSSYEQVSWERSFNLCKTCFPGLEREAVRNFSDSSSSAHSSNTAVVSTDSE